jgi:hypothetical protein
MTKKLYKILRKVDNIPVVQTPADIKERKTIIYGVPVLHKTVVKNLFLINSYRISEQEAEQFCVRNDKKVQEFILNLF